MATLDRPSHVAALASNCIDLANAGVEDLYLFKFGMTKTGKSYHDYPMQKNGIHFVDNAGRDGLNQYGGITAAGEVWRLFNAVAKRGRERLRVVRGAEIPRVWVLATREGRGADGAVEILLTNEDKEEAVRGRR